MTSEIPRERKKQLDQLAKAEETFLAWCRSWGIPMHRVEYIVPFVEKDFGAHVLFFLETDAQVTEASAPKMPNMELVFLDALAQAGYCEIHLPLVTFEVDSNERVHRDFEGNYFYRLR